MTIKRLMIISFAIIHVASLDAQKNYTQEKIAPAEMMTWATVDKGIRAIDGNSIVIEETEGANGYFLINPKVYEGDMIVRYQVKALSASSVLITLFAVSDPSTDSVISLPPEQSSGSEIWNWRRNLKHFNLTFNNVSHQHNPFIFKNLSSRSKGFHQSLAKNISEVGKWYNVEIGKQENRVWFKLDDEIIFDISDCDPLDSGQLLFRISGSNGDTVIYAKAAFRNLIIFSE